MEVRSDEVKIGSHFLNAKKLAENFAQFMFEKAINPGLH
ncbi:hypothetical protein AAULR_03414 [Lacticaseibacillus rhamnosus MTCC 5462]|nr:hypothetical protein AAULR_03414 [Lacticaseibacillus rhamnosus MTCC 5462]